MYKVPILFIIFKRKDVALKTLESIKSVKPAKLYIAGDGPRETINGEKEKIQNKLKQMVGQREFEDLCILNEADTICR